MKVLIIAKFWDASAGIAALRPMKIAKYLLKQGHEVTVLCGKEYVNSDAPCRDLSELRKCEGYAEIPAFTYGSVFKKEDDLYKRRNASAPKKAQSAPSAGNTASAPKAKQSLINRIKWYVYKTVYNTFKVNNTVKISLAAFKKAAFRPDLIISSYAPEEVHFLASKIKKMFPEAFWIADFRDPMANMTNQKPYEYRYRLKRQKRIFRAADAVTVVSNTWRDEFEALGAKNAYAVYSGFDKDDYDAINAEERKDGKLVLTYTGSLYPGLSDLRPLFKAFGELIKEGSVDPADLRFVYAGAHGAEFEEQAKCMDASVETVDCGFVERAKSLRLLKQSDVLLHALFCYPGLKGIITGKLGEYWEAGKPIVAVVTGTVRADEFISIIENSNTGFVYDGTRPDESFAELKEHLLNVYGCKKENKEIPYDRNEDFVSKFDYGVIAGQFIAIAEKNKK